MNAAMMASVHFSNEVSSDVILIIREQIISSSPHLTSFVAATKCKCCTCTIVGEWQIIPIPCQLRSLVRELTSFGGICKSEVISSIDSLPYPCQLPVCGILRYHKAMSDGVENATDVPLLLPRSQ
jgi:hypothetical protein